MVLGFNLWEVLSEAFGRYIDLGQTTPSSTMNEDIVACLVVNFLPAYFAMCAYLLVHFDPFFCLKVPLHLFLGEIWEGDV